MTPKLTPIEQQVLLRAAEIISDKAHWIQGSFGNWSCLQDEPRVCALGAVRRATAELISPGLDQVTRLILMSTNGSPDRRTYETVAATLYRAVSTSVPVVNDNQGHDAVKAMFCKAIKAEVQADATSQG